jgi:peptidyl-prolyl cis-trans isomerase C
VKKTIGIIAFILLVAVAVNLSFNGCGGKATGAEGTVIAEFDWNGKQQITLEEMQQEISELPDYKQQQYKDKKGLEEYMTLMAESRLILSLAKDRKLDEDAEIQKKVQKYFHELLVDKITELEVDQKLKLTEEDYRLYYESHKSDYVDPEQVRLTCITLTNEERAKAVLQQFKDGKDIVEVAKELSDKGELTGPGANPQNPGDTGYITRNAYSQVAQPFVEAAFALEVGKMNEELISLEVQGQTL